VTSPPAVPANAPLLLAVDGNSLLHRAHHAHAHSGQRDTNGRPTWGLRGLVTSIAGAAARLTPDAVVVGFDCGVASRRREQYPEYKAGRREKAPELVDLLAGAPDLLRAAGFAVVQHVGGEADAVRASSAALARRSGWRCAVVTSDRDSFALIDDTTAVLRLISGGIDASPLLTAPRLPAVCGVSAGQYRDYAALRGDVSDNLPGALGIGAKTAARLLAAFASVDDVYATLDSGRTDEVAAVVGAGATRRLADPAARANVARNLALMAMRDDLPMPPLADMRVPMDVPRLHAGLAERDIRLGPSLWALTGSAPPGSDSWAWLAEQDDVPAPLPGAALTPERVAPPVVAPEPEPELTLF
jgi:DNA polymerase-1